MNGKGGRARVVTRWLLVLLYAAAGVFHLVTPEPFLTITPVWVPVPETIILATGLAELAGAAALAQPWSPHLRRTAGWALAAYALCVWPANVNHMLLDFERGDGGLSLGYHVPRLLAQPLLIWVALWASGAANWPFAQRTARG